MIAVEDHHDGTVDLGDELAYRLDRHRVGRASVKEADAGMFQLMDIQDVDRQNAASAEQVHKVRVEKRRTAAVSAGFDEELWTDLRNGLLNRPEIEHVLPD